MAYKPKYSPKRNRKRSFASRLGGALAVLASVVLTVWLLRGLYFGLDTGRLAAPVLPEGLFSGTGNLEARLSALRMELMGVHGPETVIPETMATEAPAQPQTEPTTLPPETEAPQRHVYEIPAEALKAPAPNQECYGMTTNPDLLEEVLQQAAWLLEDDPMYFKSNSYLAPGSQVRYYLDDSIFAVTWKEIHNGSVYTFSEVKLAHPSQFRRHLADGQYGGEHQYKTTEMAASVNAVVASSGDFYQFRDFGCEVYQGQVRRLGESGSETCFIDTDGNLHFSYAGQFTTIEEAQAYVDENDIQFSLAFGPVLVDDYELISHSDYGVGEINEEYARSALCQMGDLHYLIGIGNVEGEYMQVPTVAQFQKVIAATGCRMAYCLDGGQTAVIAMNGELINRPAKGSQRLLSDIIYFATAVPEEG